MNLATIDSDTTVTAPPTDDLFALLDDVGPRWLLVSLLADRPSKLPLGRS